MLVISRKTSESILIGDDIEIIISDISTDKVKIAINAPKSVPVLRKELVELKEQNQVASEVDVMQAIATLKKIIK
ncbi:carbon storage regulator [Paludicola sp. MB14-C6]|uniref:carbon storage regulator n=1 Tax=Paludihabitans sp. MB14-C6 TaxID=3070656 RepID=UPI0027DD131D|nr:carbon storage regulator [Paludicola sp. MB14-C6]WMJ24261.1 carbon storage regulator [Paludicola sp. MB14-C6]